MRLFFVSAAATLVVAATHSFEKSLDASEPSTSFETVIDATEPSAFSHLDEGTRVSGRERRRRCLEVMETNCTTLGSLCSEEGPDVSKLTAEGNRTDCRIDHSMLAWFKGQSDESNYSCMHDLCQDKHRDEKTGLNYDYCECHQHENSAWKCKTHGMAIRYCPWSDDVEDMDFDIDNLLGDLDFDSTAPVTTDPANFVPIPFNQTEETYCSWLAGIECVEQNSTNSCEDILFQKHNRVCSCYDVGVVLCADACETPARACRFVRGGLGPRECEAELHTLGISNLTFNSTSESDRIEASNDSPSEETKDVAIKVRFNYSSCVCRPDGGGYRAWGLCESTSSPKVEDDRSELAVGPGPLGPLMSPGPLMLFSDRELLSWVAAAGVIALVAMRFVRHRRRALRLPDLGSELVVQVA